MGGCGRGGHRSGARAPARSSRAPAPAPAPKTSGAPAPALLSATEARNCELQRPQCSRRMRCSSGSCTETVHVRDIAAQSSARASTKGILATLRATRDCSSSTRPSQLWLECLGGTSREHACARKQSASHRRLSTPSALTRGAGRQPRAVCASSRHEEHPWPTPDDRRSRARSPGGQGMNASLRTRSGAGLLSGDVTRLY